MTPTAFVALAILAITFIGVALAWIHDQFIND